MGKMKKRAIVLVVCLTILVMGAAAQNPAEENFGWRLSVTDAAGRFLDFTHTLNLERGNIITVAIQPEKDCYGYVVQRGEDAGITILFDGALAAQRERFFYPGAAFHRGFFALLLL
jgi:hypothetical protein